ncbi:oligosaccharide flippase family protein [Natrinema zhouii]|uniref:Oligosaccharide flippase family protein n=1 Tax=Natrinema zhouii TaxID=1710539 RepID=A0A7D6GVE0_9EURY|nr:flippase [Natrinema zhouii]QLK26364.1 oligosaccharide flippase family protein [Natrinema zhouii]
MANRLISNIVSDFGGRVVHVASTGILLLVLTRALGPESYGLLALALSIFSFSRFLSESGLPWAAARYIAADNDDASERAVAAVVESWILVVVASVIVAVALAIGAEFIATLVGEAGLGGLLLVGSAYVLFYTLYRYNRGILQGYEAITATAKLHAIKGLLTLLFVTVAVLLWRTPTAAIVGYVLAFGIATLLGHWMVWQVSGLERSSITRDSDVRLNILRYNVPLSVTRLSAEVDGHLDVILVGALTNPTQVAFYTIGKQISQFTRVPAASIGFALSPSYGAETAEGRTEAATSVYQESLSKTLTLYVPVCVGLFVVADPAIVTVFGEGYAGGVLVVQVLSLFVLFEALENISGPALDYLGRARSRAVLKAITSIANVVLNVLLIPRFGAVGAAIATVITYGTYAILSVGIVSTELPFDVRAVGRSFATATAISVGMAAVVHALLGVVSGLGGLVIAIGASGVVWLVACHAFDLINVGRVADQLRG